MYVPIDSKAEKALVREALHQRRLRLDKPTGQVLREARESARHDLLKSLMEGRA